MTVVTTVPANKGPGYRNPNPDAAAAVGPRHTAVLDDRAFVVHDKATGKVLRDETQHEFWLKVLPAGTFDLHANDPRLLYDPISRRWFAWVQGPAPANAYLAVSTTPDPTQTWRGVRMPITPYNYAARIGFDRNMLYVSAHNGSANLRTAQTCYAIPMADVAAAAGPDLSNHVRSSLHPYLPARRYRRDGGSDPADQSPLRAAPRSASSTGCRPSVSCTVLHSTMKVRHALSPVTLRRQPTNVPPRKAMNCAANSSSTRPVRGSVRRTRG